MQGDTRRGAERSEYEMHQRHGLYLYVRSSELANMLMNRELPISVYRYFSLIFKHFTINGYWFKKKKKKKKFFLYTIIHRITSSEICSLYLTHSSAHTLGAVGTVHSAVDAQEMLQHGHRM